MKSPLSTSDVCRVAGITESNLRHILRRPGAPRPAEHPTARVFLWDESSVAALLEFLNGHPKGEHPEKEPRHAV